MAKSMMAKYSGTCACGCRFSKGAAIVYDRSRRAVMGCPSCGAGQGPDASDTAYEDQCAAACGIDGISGRY